MLIFYVASLIAGSVVAAVVIAAVREYRLLRRYERAWEAVAAREAAAVKTSRPVVASPRRPRRVDAPERQPAKRPFRLEPVRGRRAVAAAV